MDGVVGKMKGGEGELDDVFVECCLVDCDWFEECVG